METKTIKILAIDDNPDNLVVLMSLLSETFPEAKYIQSLSGEKGIKLCLEEKPDVILLDIVMPVMDGYEVCRKIKSNDAINYIPVIMITASRGDTQSRIKALESGANAFLSKPIDESELTVQIKTMVLLKEAEELKRNEKERLQELVNEQTRELVEELGRRIKTEEELKGSLDNLKKSRQAELNLLEDLRAEITERIRTERALSESEERFRSLYENAPIGIYRTTPDGRILLANPILVKLIGYKSFNELKHRKLNQEENFELQYSRAKILEKINSEGKLKDLETALRRKDGSIVFIRESTVLIRDNFGNPLYYDGTMEDITERKLAEEALTESRGRYKALFEGSPDAIILANVDTGVVIDANRAASELLAKSIEEIVGMHQSKLHPLRIEKIATDSFQNYIKKSKQSEKTAPYETLVLRSDGVAVPVEILSKLINVNGKPVIHGVFRDISWRKQAEEALKESEGRFRSLFENMVEGFAFCRMFYENGQPQDFIYLDVNQSFETLTGLKDAKGKKVSEVIPGIRQSDPVLFETYSRVALSGKTERFESYVESLKMWFHISVYSPAKEYFVAVFDIINERKLAEEALKESEEKYRRMVDISPDAVIIHSEGTILFANPASLNLIGAISSDQLINHDIFDFLHPESNAVVHYLISKMFITGKSAGITELKFITLRNEVIDAEVIGIPVNYLGKPAIQTIARDITKRKRAENALKESHEFNSSLLMTLPFGMQIVDETGTILFIDEKLNKIFKDQARGKKCWELYRDDRTQCCDCPLFTGIEIGKTNNYEAKGVLGGKIFDITNTGMMFEDKKAMLEIFQDITERKREEAELIVAKEKAEESNRLKYAFLATMNHELRTPLNHILGFSSLIQSGVEESESKDYAATIETSGKNLLSIIEDIFELSLVEQADIKVRRQTFSLMDNFMENKASLDEFLHSSGKNEQIELIFKPGKGLLSRYITSDRSKINQVLSNLFKNAIKFTHSGIIEFGCQMQSPGKLMFYVKDTGIGISNEKQSIIFDFFRQIDDTHTRLYGGIGIGLAISLKITQVLNGELKVDSEPGKGSTFWFTVPVEIADSGSQTTSISQHKIDLDLSGNTILIIEDDPFSMTLVRNFMKNTNVRLIEAIDGEEAIGKWKLHPEIDLVLMDLKMPGMDGFEATRIIKSEKPELPIIALTAYSLTEDKAKAMDAGCDGVLTKPLEKTLLFAELKKRLC